MAALLMWLTGSPVTPSRPSTAQRGAPLVAAPARPVPPQPGKGVDAWVQEAADGVRKRPADGGAYVQLAIAYMRKQRQCGDPDYYTRAEGAVRKALALQPDSYNARKIMAWVLAGQHRFDVGRRLARECIHQHPSDPWPYGVLADAESELGNYPAAVDAVQQMVNLKPDLTSYSRAAHQRALHGDPEGALELFDMALDCTGPRDPEAAAWCHTQKGQVRFDLGDARGADAAFQRALELEPGYHLALAGRARCRTALGHYREAASLYEQALRVIPRPDWTIALGDLKQAMGDPAGAESQYAAARAAIRAQPPGPDNDRQLALFLADHRGDPQAALDLARRAARSRHDLYTVDALAWACFRSGRYQEAWRLSRQARRLGTRDALLFYHAGMIARRLPGRDAEGTALLRKALALNPGWDPLNARTAREALGEREGGVRG
jgi:tetratricopeptide (TPR) repeat protein